MPLPRKTKVRVNLDEDLLAEIEYELAERDVACELNCGGQATTMYLNERSAVFMCRSCRQTVELATGALRTDLDKNVSEIMFSGLLRRSYVHLNNESGFKLEQLVATFQDQVKNLDKLDERRAKNERREIRQNLVKAQSQVGMPDEELLTARQRNDLRARRGQPTRGPQRKPRELKSVPSATLEVPTPSITAAEASLPFPEIELI